MPFLPALAILFIALKLLGFIEWSWWWVLSPLWGAVLLIVTIYAGAFAIMFSNWRKLGRRNSSVRERIVKKRR